MKLTYCECSTGWHTEVSYMGDDGSPMAARFAGRWYIDEVETTLKAWRANDRNRVSP